MRSSQNGNAIVIILVAVALFAGLAYTFMSGAKSGTGNLTSGRASIYAQEIIDYGKQIESRINKLRQQGCSEQQFDMENSVWAYYDNTPFYAAGHNTNAPGDDSCDVFGAQFKARNIDVSMTDLQGSALSATSTKLGSMAIFVANMPGIGVAGNKDLVLILPWINNETCMKINDMLGITNGATLPPTHGGLLYTASSGANNSIYNGSMTAGAGTISDTSGGNITGKTAFCSRYVLGGITTNRYFQILLAR